ncbi:MAG: 50S ribosomal protein L30e [Euryarchaeota archaeon]|nr:50S ribosomal protein L30e [Euryarchaeota archaeon]
MVDINKALRVAIETGEVVIGSEKTIDMAKLGKAKLIIVAANCPSNVREDIIYYAALSGIPVYTHHAANVELGPICGKPFGISALAVKDPGNSDILHAVEGAQ